MADPEDVLLPATGTGTADVRVAVDSITGTDALVREYQYVKLADGTADNADPIEGSWSDGHKGLMVEDRALRRLLEEFLVAQIAASGTFPEVDLHILRDPQLKASRLSAMPAVSTSPAYTAKDAVGGMLTFLAATSEAGGACVVQTAVVIDNSQQMPALDLVLFDRPFTAAADNAIFAPSDDDLSHCVGVIPIAAWSDFSTNSVATRFGIGLAANCYDTALYGQLVTRTAVTFVATTDITVILDILRD